MSPYKSLVINNGFDIDSVHAHPNHFTNILYKTQISKKKKFKLPDKVVEDFKFYEDLELFFKKRINLEAKVKNIFKNFIIK